MGNKAKAFFSNWIVKNLLAAVAVVAVVVGAAALLLNIVTYHNKEYSVPDLTGMSVKDAEFAAHQEGMRTEVVDSVYVSRLRRGAVYRQNPPAGAKVKKGRRIVLTINAVTPKKVTMPNLIGYSMRQAKAELASRGLTLGKLIYVNDIATNNVLRQIHDNMQIEPGVPIESESVIDLVVGLNDSDHVTYIPDVRGLKTLSAADAIHDNSLNIRKMIYDESVKNYDDTLSATVYRQVPSATMEPCRMGSEVTLYLTADKVKQIRP